MEPDRRNQISDLFHAALTRARRTAAFLEGAPQRSSLRQEIESW